MPLTSLSRPSNCTCSTCKLAWSYQAMVCKIVTAILSAFLAMRSANGDFRKGPRTGHAIPACPPKARIMRCKYWPHAKPTLPITTTSNDKHSRGFFAQAFWMRCGMLFSITAPAKQEAKAWRTCASKVSLGSHLPPYHQVHCLTNGISACGTQALFFFKRRVHASPNPSS